MELNNNPFSPKILKYLFKEVKDFTIKFEDGTEVMVNRAIMHAYSNIIKANPNLNEIEMEKMDIIKYFNNMFKGKENLEIISDINFAEGGEVKTYMEKDLKVGNYDNFSVNESLIKHEGNQIFQIDLKDNSEKIITSGTNKYYYFRNEYLFFKSEEKLILFNTETNKEIWSWPYGNLIGGLTFSLQKQYVRFDFKGFEFILNLKTLKLFKLNFKNLELDHLNNFDLEGINSLDDLVVFLSKQRLQEIEDEEKERFGDKISLDISARDFDDEYLIFSSVQKTTIVNFKTKTIINTHDVVFRENYQEFILCLKIHSIDKSILIYFKNNFLIQKTKPIRFYPRQNDKFGFDGKKFLFIEREKIYSVKKETLKKISVNKSSFDETINNSDKNLQLEIKPKKISFNGNYMIAEYKIKERKEREVENPNRIKITGTKIFELKTFYNNPFDQEEVSFIIENYPDIKIILKAEEFMFNKSILYAYSETFRIMLSDSLTESQSLNDIPEFDLSPAKFQFTSEDFLDLFATIFTNTSSHPLLRQFLGIS